MEYPFKDLLPLDEVLEREGYYKDWTHLDPEVFYSLTQISEYIKTKGFGVDVRLLIAQLAEHFGLRVTQITDAMAEFGDLNNKVGELINKYDQTEAKAELSISRSAEALSKSEVAITKSQNALNVANRIDAKATNALDISKSSDTLSKSVQDQFNQVVIDGDSSVESAQARVNANGVTKATLKERLDDEHNEVTSQLAQAEKNQKIGMSHNVKKPETTVVFVSDDNALADYTILKPIFEARGVPCVIGTVTDWLDIPNKMSTEQLLELQNELGWEVASHTVSHPPLPSVSLEQAEIELRESKRILESKGFRVNNFVYPNNQTNNDIRALVSKYYNYACYGNGLINTLPLTPFSLHRVSLGAYFDGDGTSAQYGDTTKFDTYYKVKVDEAIAEGKSLLIFMLHSGFSEFDQEQQGYLEDTIDYVLSKGVDILTLNDAVAKMGNYLSVGNYNWETPEDYFVISSEGKIKSSYGQQFIVNDANINANTPLSYFQKEYGLGSITIKSGNDLNMPIGGNVGTLTTYSSHASDFSYQIWEPYDNSDVYKRAYDFPTKQWKEFKLISENNFYQRVSGANTHSATSPITEFPVNAISVTTINSQGVTGFPESAPGLLTTNRLSGTAGYPRQTYEPYNKNSIYIRYWTTSSSWSTWISLATKTNVEVPPVIAGFELLSSKTTRRVLNTTQVLSGNNSIVVTPVSTIPDGIIWSWTRADSQMIFINFFNANAQSVTIPNLTWNVTQFMP